MIGNREMYVVTQSTLMNCETYSRRAEELQGVSSEYPRCANEFQDILSEHPKHADELRDILEACTGIVRRT